MFDHSKKKEAEEQDLWKNFHGRGNSNDILAEKAKILAAVILDWARTGTLELIKHQQKDKGGENSEEKFAEVFLESVILYVHFTDRIAFQLLETPQRNYFMDALIKEVTNIFSESQSTQIQKTQLNLTINNLYNKRQIEYGNYKISAAEHEGLGGTLFWEFDKKIANIFGFADDIITITQTQACIISGLKFIQLPKLFEK